MFYAQQHKIYAIRRATVREQAQQHIALMSSQCRSDVVVGVVFAVVHTLCYILHACMYGTRTAYAVHCQRLCVYVCV